MFLWRVAGVVLGVCTIASGQAVVKPERVEDRPVLLDSPATASKLRCRLEEINPELDFSLQFRTGFVLDVPMSQFEGTVRPLNSAIQVTPENLSPYFLQSTGEFLKPLDGSTDGEIRASFIVGEGSYDVEVVVEDDTHRVCRNKWHVQAQYSSNEKTMIPPRSPDTVESLKTPEGAAERIEPLPGNGRLTVVINASPLVDPNAAKFPETDIETIAGTLTSLLRQLPAKSVRLMIFNIDHRAVLLREDDFTSSKMAAVTDALKELQVLAVDYRTLQQKPGEVISEWIEGEVKNLSRQDTMILLGPNAYRPLKDDIRLDDEIRASRDLPSVFYLQYDLGLLPYQRQRMNRIVIMNQPNASFDNFSRVIGRLKGKTFTIHTPNEFVDALRLIKARMGRL